MTKEIIKKELVAEDLELQINNLKLGEFTTNALNIKEIVEKSLVNYDEKNYSEENIDKAIEDKALLNKSAKTLNDERIRIEKEFMEPFNEFKMIVTETCDLIKKASSEIDVIVKNVEAKAKAKRKKIIENIFNNTISELKEIITLEMIFDDKWLNKGSFNDKGDFKLVNELTDKINKIESDLKSIKNLNSKHELALNNQYLNNFDLGQVINENNRLNELEKKTIIIEEKREEVKETKIEEMLINPIQEKEIDPIKTYTLKISAPLSKLKKLKEFMKLNNIEFENLENKKEEED